MFIKNGKDSIKFIRQLKNLVGAMDYDGDASCQVLFDLKNGKTLRIGTTDKDVAKEEGIWIDQFEGVKLKTYHA